MEAIEKQMEVESIHFLETDDREDGFARTSMSGRQGVSNHIDASPEAVILCNPRYRIVDANPKAVELLGYPHAVLLTLTLAMVCPGFEEPGFQKALQSSVRKDNACLIADLRRADGYSLKVAIEATLLDSSTGTVTLVFQEIKNHRRSITAIQTHGGDLGSLIRVTLDTAVRLNLEGSIVRLNRGFAACGWEPDDLWGQPLIQFIHPHDRHTLTNCIHSCIPGRPAGKLAPIRIQIKPKGENDPEQATTDERAYQSYSFAAEGIYSDFGDRDTLCGHWVILRDLTEEIKAAATRDRLEAQLLQAQKMEAIGALAGGIAHDFNNILAAIFGNAQLAKMALPEAHKAYPYIQHIWAAGHRAKSLVGQILAFSRASKPVKKAVDLGCVVKEAYRLLRACIPSTIDIRQNISTQRRTIMADPTQIHQVLMNLCTNALHALDGNSGHLDISLTDVELAMGDPDCIDLDPGPYLRLVVTDDGCGMDTATVPNIFKPYFTTKDAGKGTGLGLSTVRGIVEDHGGSIGVRSEPGRGTAITIYLPCNDDPVKGTSPPPQILHTGSEQLLLVDDEKVLAEIVEQMLTRLGYQVDVKTCPIEAMATFKNNPHKYQLVMTDMTMPGMTGVCLAEAVMEIEPQMPVIICSGFNNLIDPAKTVASGIRGFIKKPFTIDHLSLRVRQALDSHLMT